MARTKLNFDDAISLFYLLMMCANAQANLIVKCPNVFNQQLQHIHLFPSDVTQLICQIIIHIASTIWWCPHFKYDGE